MNVDEVLDAVEYHICDGLPFTEVFDALIHLQAGVARLLNRELTKWTSDTLAVQAFVDSLD